MTLQQLEYIIALDIHRHYVRAAESCFVTQPTITLQVKKLEHEIGVQIFNRSKTPLEPTASGELILAKARIILQEMNQLKELVSNEVDSTKGDFKIGVIPTISPYVIPEFTKSFTKNHLQTKLHISEMQTETIIDQLLKGQIDVGILVTPLDEPALREIPLYNESFVFYGHSSLKVKSKISTEDLENLDGLWLLKSGHCFRSQLLNLCGKSLENRNIEFQSGSIETLKRMVDIYGGYTLIPEMAISEKDKVNHFKNPKPVREVSLVVHKSFPKEGFLDAVRGELLKVIPDSLERNKQFFRVRWR